MIVRAIEIALSAAFVLLTIAVAMAAAMVGLSPADAAAPVTSAAVEWVAPNVLPD